MEIDIRASAARLRTLHLSPAYISVHGREASVVQFSKRVYMHETYKRLVLRKVYTNTAASNNKKDVLSQR